MYVNRVEKGFLKYFKMSSYFNEIYRYSLTDFMEYILKMMLVHAYKHKNNFL